MKSSFGMNLLNEMGRNGTLESERCLQSFHPEMKQEVFNVLLTKSLINDVIYMILDYAQEIMLLLQGGPIQDKAAPPNFMTIYDPSNNTWTNDDDDGKKIVF